jgi:hypothetical protein
MVNDETSQANNDDDDGQEQQLEQPEKTKVCYTKIKLYVPV